MKKNIKYAIKYSPIIFCIIILIIFFSRVSKDSLRFILNYTPHSPVYAALAMVILFVLKSLVVFLPVSLLQVAGGHFLSLIQALIINLIGALICSLVPYFIGRKRGAGAIDKLSEKYPKLMKIIDKQNENDFIVSFIFRVISFFPNDLSGMYLGASGISFTSYFAGSLAGAIPGTVAATFIGSGLTEPSSPAFILSLAGYVAVVVASVWLYSVYKNKAETA